MKYIILSLAALVLLSNAEHKQNHTHSDSEDATTTPTTTTTGAPTIATTADISAAPSAAQTPAPTELSDCDTSGCDGSNPVPDSPANTAYPTDTTVWILVFGTGVFVVCVLCVAFVYLLNQCREFRRSRRLSSRRGSFRLRRHRMDLEEQQQRVYARNLAIDAMREIELEEQSEVNPFDEESQ
jgi:hypothetical protein